MSKNDTAVDFNNPESIAQELEAVSAIAEATPKAKKVAKPRVVKVSFTADKDYATGDVITFDYEIPKSLTAHGVVSGIPLDEMTAEQLKIEYRNANSVFYKTKKAGRDFTKAEVRLNTVKAAMEAKGIQPSARGTTPLDADAIVALILSGKINIADLQAGLDAKQTTVTE